MYFECFFRRELGFLDCDDTGMCVVNKHFELLDLVFNSDYVDLKYNEISLIPTAGLCDCVVCVIMWSSLICLWDCLSTLCGHCDPCTVFCLACEYAYACSATSNW